MARYPRKSFDLNGTAVTTTADEMNVLASSGMTAADAARTHNSAAQTLVADGAITVKNGVCIIAKTVAGAVAATLADPTTGTDDYKRLLIINGQTQANTVASATSFGGGGATVDVATFANVVGNTLALMAYAGKWYVTGSLGVTLA